MYKAELWKTGRLTSFQKSQYLLQPVSIFLKFEYTYFLVYLLSLIPSFNILNGYFDVSLNLVAVPSAQILMNFRTQLLYVTVS